MACSVHVTGASGFLGRWVVPQLVERGYRVTALARSGEAARRIRALGAEPRPGDLEDPDSLDLVFEGADCSRLVNLASLGFGHAPAIVAAAEEAGLRRAIFISTTAVFTKLDAASKAVRLAAERTIRSSGLDWTIIRPTMIYGAPGDRNMSRLLGFLRRWPVVPIPGGGYQLQQPIHVADLATVIVRALERDVAIGRAYDVAGPAALTFRQMIAEASAATGRTTRAIGVPTRPIVGSLAMLESLGATLPLRAEQIVRLTEDKAFDIAPAVKDLGFDPQAFRDGIMAEAIALRR